MSVCGEYCEKPFFLGVAGVCDTNTGLCICPEGYHGKDDWAEYNDCHVNIAVQNTLHYVLSGLVVFSAIVGLCGFLYLVRHWDFVRVESPGGLSRRFSMASRKSSFGDDNSPKSQRNSPSSPSFLARISSNFSLTKKNSSESILPRTVSLGSDDAAFRPRQMFFSKPRPSMGKNKRTAVEQWKRQRDTLVAIVLCLMFLITGSIYIMPMALGEYRFEGKWYIDLGLGLAAPSLLVSMWMVVYIWYRSLPSLRVYQKLFDIRNPLLEHPDVIRNLTLFHCGLIYIASVGCCFIVPMASDNIDVIRRANRAFLSIALLFIVDFCIFFFMLLLFLRRIFNQLADLTSQREDFASGPQDDIQKSLNTVLSLIAVALLIGPLALLFFVFLTVTELGFRNIYVFFNGLAIMGCFIVFLIIWVFAIRLRGEKVGEKKEDGGVDEVANMNNYAEHTFSSSGMGGGRSSWQGRP